jgi:hypothetical protein
MPGQGLAAKMAGAGGPQGQAPMGGGMGPGMGQGPGGGAQEQREQIIALLKEVIQLLLQGVSPEELIKKGVPREIVEKAIQIIQQQQAQGGAGGGQPMPQGQPGPSPQGV